MLGRLSGQRRLSVGGRAWPTSSSSRWWHRSRPGRRRPRKRPRKPSAAPSVTTSLSAQAAGVAGGGPVATAGRRRAWRRRQGGWTSPSARSAGSGGRSTASRSSISLCMLPARGLLVLFLTYPLGLGLWLGLHRHPDRPRRASSSGSTTSSLCSTTAVFRLARLQHPLLHHRRHASVKFALGLWLALLLNNHLPFKSFLRADRADPLDRADRAVGDRLLVDLRPAVLDHLLRPGRRAGLARHLHRLPRRRPGTRACR